MAEISIIGAGRLGTSLAIALRNKGHTIKALSCRRRSSAIESRRLIEAGRAFTDNGAAAREGEIIFLCLPDEEIKKVACKLSRIETDWRKKTVFHTSGLLGSDVLEPLRKQGAAVASFHPIQTFSQKVTPLRHWKGIYFGLEGGSGALSVARQIIRQLGGHPLILEARLKPLYHGACSIASNFFVVLLDTAAHLLQEIGVDEEKASRLLLPLAQGTLHNVKRFDIPKSLTGPVIRGDSETVRAHLKALHSHPDYSEVYKKLGLLALRMIPDKELPARKIRALKNLLEDK